MKRIYRSRAPLRLGFAGGGSDVSPYCDIYGGYVLNATINHYAHCSIEPRDLPGIEFFAADRNEREFHAATDFISADDGLTIHRQVYNTIVERFNEGQPLQLQLVTYCDAPPGSGLGSSSTLVVAIVHAYSEWFGLPLGEYDIARLAYEIERVQLNKIGGRQDQYAASFGGFNFMEFGLNEQVVVNPLRIKRSITNELESSLVLYNSTVSRLSSNIIQEQVENVVAGDSQSINATHAVKQDALKMKEALLKGDYRSIGRILNSSWQSKKSMAGSINTMELERTMAIARESGAVAGKVSGAGGGGFIMFMVDPAERIQLETALKSEPGQLLPFRFSLLGSEVWSIEAG